MPVSLIPAAGLGTSVSNPITQADQWHLTTTAGNVTSQVVSSNWARIATTGFARIGSGMSESSGIFTFPTTGLYLVSGQMRFYYDSPRRYVQIFIQTTTNNSTYTDAAIGSGQLYSSGADSYATTYSQTLFNVTSTSLCKVRFSVDCQAATNLFGISNRYDTGVTFIRIGDSQ